MANMILTYNDLDSLNHFLQEQNTGFKVHMHDMCGNQSFTVEALNGSVDINRDTVSNEIIRYFGNKGLILKFTTEGKNFVIVS